MRIKITIFYFISAIISGGAYAQPAAEGQQLFSQRCAACHKVGQVLTGPDLANVHERRNNDWLIKFVRSSQSVIKSGDQYAKDLYDKFNHIPMPDQPDLTDQQITGIIEYIKAESAKLASNTAPFAKPARIRPAYLPVSFAHNSGFIIAFIGLVILMVFVMLMGVEAKAVERRSRTDAVNE